MTARNYGCIGLFCVGVAFCIFAAQISVGKTTSAIPVSASQICSAKGTFVQTNKTTNTTIPNIEDRQTRAKQWLASMMKSLGSNSIGGGSISASQHYNRDYTGKIAGTFTINDASHAKISHTLITVDDESQAAEGYRGTVTGKINAASAGNYEVRAYLYTDSEYAQPNATVGIVKPDGTWSLSTSSVDSKFKGVWHFRLYNTDTNTEVGQSWPRQKTYKNLEVRYYLEDSGKRQLQASKPATVDGKFTFFANNNPGYKVFQLVKADTGEILAEDYRPETSGLIRSYEYLPGMDGYNTSRQQNTYTYDQALALLVAIAGNDRAASDKLLQGLHQIQVKSGEFAGAFPSSSEQNNPANTDKTYYTGGNAFALYALARYIEAYGDVNGAVDMLRAGLNYIDKVRTESGAASGLYQGGRSVDSKGVINNISWHSTEHNTDLWHALERSSRVLKDSDIKKKADSLASAIMSKLWNSAENRFNQGFDDDDYALDTASWGSIFLSAIGEHKKAIQSANNAELYRHASARAVGYTPYINRTNSVPTVWYEGTYGVALSRAVLGDSDKFTSILSESIPGQRSGGGFPYADDADIPNGRNTATSVASTAWFLLATLYPSGIWSECKAPDTNQSQSVSVQSDKTSDRTNSGDSVKSNTRSISSKSWKILEPFVAVFINRYLINR